MAANFQFLATLPPAVDGGDDMGVERVVEFRLEFHFAGFRFQKNPVAVGDTICRRGCRINFDKRFWYDAAQARNVAVLLIAEVDISKEC